jgi:hypothetical protein
MTATSAARAWRREIAIVGFLHHFWLIVAGRVRNRQSKSPVGD